MQLTQSYETAVPADVLARYEMAEVRNAAAVLSATNPAAFAEIIDVLRDFELTSADLLMAGGNEGAVAARLNDSFRIMGWREARVDSLIQHTLVVFPYAGAGERRTREVAHEPVPVAGYKADWMKDRIAGDVEWNAKDGNLDRDVASYRSLYETGFIDGAVLITRTQDDLRLIEASLIGELQITDVVDAAEALGVDPGRVADALKRIRAGQGTRNVSRLGTTTTTNLPKLLHRLKRGDGGGCPILAVAISQATWDGRRLSR